MTPFGFPRLFVDGVEVVLHFSLLVGEAVSKWLVDTQPQFIPTATSPELQAFDVLSRYAERDDPYAIISMSKAQVDSIRAIRELNEYNHAYIDYAVDRMNTIKQRLCLFITPESGMYIAMVSEMERLSTALYILCYHGEAHSRQPAARKDLAGRWIALDVNGYGAWNVTRWEPDFRSSKSEVYTDHDMALACFADVGSDFGDRP